MKLNEQQRLAVETIDNSMCISAGAGSGKTKVLVERFIKLVLSGIPVEQILAITFTRKAAAEMVERIRKALEQADLPWPQKIVLKEKLGGAWIGTIHSICSRILREHPVEAGIDPSFVIAAEVDINLVKKETARRVILNSLSNDDTSVQSYLTEYGYYRLVNDLPNLYTIMDNRGVDADHLEKLTMRALLEEKIYIPEVIEGIKGSLAQLQRVAVNVKKGTKTYARLEEIMAMSSKWTDSLEKTVTCGYGEEEYELLDHIIQLCKGNVGKEVRNDIAELRNYAEELQNCWSDLDSMPYLQTLFRLLREFGAILAEEKQRHNMLDYNDLEKKVLGLLQQRPLILENYCQQFKHIMVDEFQDTNYRQVEIIRLLTGSAAAEKVFLVGDPKQSIYRFRGAQAELFSKADLFLSQNGGLSHSLDNNYRTRAGVLNFINNFFSCLMDDDNSIFQSLTPNRGMDSSKPQVEIHLIEEQPDVDISTAESEAYCVAARIQQMTTGNEKIVYRQDEDGKEKLDNINYADIAILFRTAGDIDVFAAVLAEQDIPHYVAGSRSFYAAEEVRAIITALRAIENRYDELSLTGVLRSSMFGISDETLWLLKKGGRPISQGMLELDDIKLESEEKEELCRALDILNSLNGLKYRLSVRELVQLLLERTGYEYLLAARENGRQALGNIQKLILLTEQFESSERVGLHGFINYLNELRKQDIQEEQAVIEAEAGNTVKMMTIHQAKGLEFPVVIIPQMDRKFNLQDITERVIVCDERGMFLKGKLAPGKLRQEVAEIEKQKVLAEYKRLLYVALTRARDYLIMSGFYGIDKEGEITTASPSWLNWLKEVFEDDEVDLKSSLEERNIITAFYRQDELPVPEKTCHKDNFNESDTRLDAPDLPAGWQEIRQQGTRDRYLSASMIMDYNYCPVRAFLWHKAGLKLEGYSGERSGYRSKGLKANDLGSLVHYLIEKGDTLEKAVALLESYRDTLKQEEYDEIALMLQTFYEDVSIQKLSQTHKLLKEVPFLAKVETGTYLRGFIDQLWLGSDEHYIIDLKTGQEKDDSYALQLNTYGMAVGTILGSSRTQKGLFYLRQSKVVWMDDGKVEIDFSYTEPAEYKNLCRDCPYRDICFGSNGKR